MFTKVIAMIVIILVKPKAAAKFELLLNKLRVVDLGIGAKYDHNHDFYASMHNLSYS